YRRSSVPVATTSTPEGCSMTGVWELTPTRQTLYQNVQDKHRLVWRRSSLHSSRSSAGNIRRLPPSTRSDEGKIPLGHCSGRDGFAKRNFAPPRPHTTTRIHHNGFRTFLRSSKTRMSLPR